MNAYLSPKEKEIVSLYNALQKIRLEISVLQALNSNHTHIEDNDIHTAQDKLLKSQTNCTLRRDVIENIISIAPTLNAIEKGPNITPLEKDLEAYLKIRDQISKSLVEQTTQKEELEKEAMIIRARLMVYASDNKRLAGETIRLASLLQKRKETAIDSTNSSGQFTQWDLAIQSSHQKWKVIKETIGAIVVGSGINWAQDLELLNLVADPSDDHI